MSKQEIATRIKSARVEKGWKQKHLAAAVRVEPMTVSRWERGATTPDFDALSLIAEATEKPLGYFLPENEGDLAEPRLREAAERLEAAAERLEEEAARIASVLEEVRSELARLR